MFLPRLRPLKGHERSCGYAKWTAIYFVLSSTDECKYISLNVNDPSNQTMRKRRLQPVYHKLTSNVRTAYSGYRNI